MPGVKKNLRQWFSKSGVEPTWAHWGAFSGSKLNDEWFTAAPSFYVKKKKNASEPLTSIRLDAREKCP